MSRWSVLLEASRHNARANVRYVRRALKLTDAETGDVYGYIDRATVVGGRIVVEGWTRSARLRLGDRMSLQCVVSPSFRRPDVEAACAVTDQRATGFSAEVEAFGQLRVQVQPERGGDWRPCAPVRLHGPARRLAAGLAGVSRTFGAILAAPGEARAAWREGGAGLRSFLLRAGRPSVPDSLLDLDCAIFARSQAPAGAPKIGPAGAPRVGPKVGPKIGPRGDPAPVTVIVPVYNSFETLRPCLARAVAHADRPFSMIVVNDASTDRRVAPWLAEWAAGQGVPVRVIEAPRNRGFVASVNAALGAVEDGHVVLLNSDAMVPAGWLSRLTAPLEDAAVASVTPMSNDAEIMTVAAICRGQPLPDGAVEEIDRAARRLGGAGATVDLPTGVGFCMAMSARFLAEIPRFDSVFGRGYGEEVDWCQKARTRGGRHVGLAGLFVEHRGAGSFGRGEKAALVARHNALIARRYPDYDAEVQAFIRNDPLVTARLCLGAALAAASAGRLPVFLAHSLGGGSEIYLQRRIARLVRQGGGALVLRVDHRAAMVKLELHSAAGIAAAWAERVEDMAPFLAALPPVDLVYSCLVSAQRPLDMLRAVRRLLSRPGDRFEILLHDHFPICPSYNLLDVSGRFCGLPGIEACRACLSAPNPHAGAHGRDIGRWRAAWGGLLAEADRIEAFAEAGRALVVRAYPDLAGRVAVVPHDLGSLPPRVHAAAQPGGDTVGILGNIGYHKGAGMLRDLADLGEVPRMVVIGQFDPAFAHDRIVVHGAYQIGELADLVRLYGIDRWLQPAIWPETFSFTTHEMLATGLPVLGFDLGAQGETLRAAPNGIAVPVTTPPRELARLLRPAPARGAGPAPLHGLGERIGAAG